MSSPDSSIAPSSWPRSSNLHFGTDCSNQSASTPRTSWSSAAESATWHARHAAWFLDVVAERLPGSAGWAGPQEIVAFDRSHMEHDNLRAALRWFLDQRDGPSALRLTTATYRFWDRRGYYVGGVSLVRSGAGHRARRRRSALHGVALNAAAQANWVRGDYARSVELAERAIRVCEAAGDQRGVAWAWTSTANTAHFQGEDERAQPLFERALAHARSAGDGALLAITIAFVLPCAALARATTAESHGRASRRSAACRRAGRLSARHCCGAHGHRRPGVARKTI